MVDAATGEIRTELLGQPGGTFQIEPVPGTDQFASAGFVGAVGVVIFDASPLGGVEVGGWICRSPSVSALRTTPTATAYSLLSKAPLAAG